MRFPRLLEYNSPCACRINREGDYHHHPTPPPKKIIIECYQENKQGTQIEIKDKDLLYLDRVFLKILRKWHLREVSIAEIEGKNILCRRDYVPIP